MRSVTLTTGPRNSLRKPGPMAPTSPVSNWLVVIGRWANWRRPSSSFSVRSTETRPHRITCVFVSTHSAEPPQQFLRPQGRLWLHQASHEIWTTSFNTHTHAEVLSPPPRL